MEPDQALGLAGWRGLLHRRQYLLLPLCRNTTFLNRVAAGAITGYSSVHVLAEAILALRATWKSQDARWERLWANRPAYVLAKIKKQAA